MKSERGWHGNEEQEKVQKVTPGPYQTQCLEIRFVALQTV